MKITLNPDEEIVKTVKDGLEKTGGYLPVQNPAHKRIPLYVQGV